MAEMTAQEAVEWGKTLDFSTVWATLTKLGETVKEMGERLDETGIYIKEMGERVDRVTGQTGIYIKEMGERVDRVTDQTGIYIKEMGERVDRVASNVGGLNNSMGELVETLFAPHLGEKFDVYNYNLKRIFKRVNIYDDTSRQRGEIDILLSNTTVCMAVEVKRWLDNTEKVDEHIRRMQLIRKYPPAETKGKKLLGAIAAAVVSSDVREYAEQNGFFVLELTGEDVRLLEPPKDFQPKEW